MFVTYMYRKYIKWKLGLTYANMDMSLTAKKTHIQKLQTYQSIFLRTLVRKQQNPTHSFHSKLHSFLNQGMKYWLGRGAAAHNGMHILPEIP